MEGHIFIQGVISPWQDTAAEEWGEVNIKQVTQQIQDNKDAGKLIVHIHSPGGDVDEGFGIHDILVAHGKDKGVEIETRIEGLCASIATVVFLAGSVRKVTENSDAMVHNPWMDVWGDADDLQKSADQLKIIEDKILDFYVAKTGGNKEAISAMMKEETWLSAQQLKDLGFATEIITTIKAVAKFNVKKNIMNTQDLNKTIDTKFESILTQIKNLFKAKMLTTTAADGTVLDFGDQAATIEDVEVGMTATIEGGGVPDGDLVMPDGGTWVFDNGTLTEMKPPEEEETEEMKQLKAENEELKKQLAELRANNEAAVEGLKEEIVAFKAQIKSDISTFEKGGIPQSDGGQKESRFSDLKPKMN